MRSARPLALAAAPLVLALLACSKPEPPTVRPVSGRFVGISATGLDVEAKLEATNPNDFEIKVKSFTADVTLDHRIKVGSITSASTITLPPKQKKVFEIPISVKWEDVSALVPLGLSNRNVPWEAEGKVKLSADDIDVSLPFKVDGVLTHQQITTAVSKSIPQIPGLPF
jgi:LEA14-like dessication related protein